MFSRSDAALLYLARRYVHIGVEILVDIRRRIQLQLLDNVPLFTMKLGPGLAFAEDPGNSESFGTARCRLLAEGIWAAFQRGTWRTEDRLGIVEEHFKTQGISLERPWLSPGSTGDFGFGVDEPWAA
jgi:hypothetical protein